MRVTIKLFATLRNGRFREETRELKGGTTVGQVLQELAIGEEEASLVFVNGRHAEAGAALEDGDVLALFPPIGGG